MLDQESFYSLLHNHVMGFYNCCEQITVFIEEKKTHAIYNYYTIFVFEERLYPEGRTEFLTSKPVALSKSLNLGCLKKVISLSEAEKIFGLLCGPGNRESVDIGDGELKIGRLEALDKVFVPQNSTKTSSLNRILKNNFRNGSYILEFFDVQKRLRELFGKEILQKAAKEVYKLLPIDLFTISDRIGNFLFQFPSLNVRLSYTRDESKKNLIYHICFDERLGLNEASGAVQEIKRLPEEEDGQPAGTMPETVPGSGRQEAGENVPAYELTAEISYDDNVIGFCRRQITESGIVRMAMGEAKELCRSTLVESNSNLIVSAQEGNFLQALHLRMHMGQQHGMKRILYDVQGAKIQEIEVTSAETLPIYYEEKQEWREFIQERQYKQRMEDLERRMEFIHYGLGGVKEREKALTDLRALMNRGDGSKVYLWDPYLNARDLLDTWYYTTTYGLKLHCITSAEGGKQPVQDWMKEQAGQLAAGSNQYGICLEFRCQWGNYGYGFHDRFLMIVDGEDRKEPQVWSLGTSVNSLGMKHHIVQKVLHPQPIVDAFEKLWEMLLPAECCIWNYGEQSVNVSEDWSR